MPSCVFGRSVKGQGHDRAVLNQEAIQMMTGLLFVVMGVLILFYPRILEVFVAGLLMLFGLGAMATSWQFRRLRKQSQSRFINWIIRF